MAGFEQLKYYIPSSKQKTPETFQADLCIYGGTSAGVAAAIQATRMGLSVIIAEFSQHLGGMTTGGLGRTDIGNKAAIGGISREFYRELGKHYGVTDGDGTQWNFEPSVAQRIYREWIDKAGVAVYYHQHLETVEKVNGKITEIKMENGNVFRASMFMDATYEGDLFARAGVSYHTGRESNDVYKETLNGIQFGSKTHTFLRWIDPYVVEGKPDSGLLAGVKDLDPGIQGDGDDVIQAYNFRICLTNVPDNRVPFPKPPQYEPDRFTLLARYIQGGIWDAMNLHKMMPNGKTDLNNYGAVSTDHIGENYEWPDGDYETRERIFQDHLNYNLGMLYFLSHDERVPQYVREEVSQWGLPADEYPDTGHWSPQLYIREGRRMISDVVMNENHCRKFEVVEDSVGLAAYTMDSHNGRRLVIHGRCVNEGNVEVSPTGPYPISYRAIVPKGEECTNLLVPVGLSSSHIAFGSIRMEPVFMILGQSAATAAAIALEANSAVQDVEYAELRKRLLADHQILDWME